MRQEQPGESPENQRPRPPRSAFRAPSVVRPVAEHHEAAVRLAEQLSAGLGEKTLPLVQAQGLRLARDVQARWPLPGFSNSAMDGFLVHGADLAALEHRGAPVTLPVVGDVPAGASAMQVPEGAAVRIMTGAPLADPVPEGLRVVPVEATSTPPGPIECPKEVRIERWHPKRNIRFQGSQVRPGELMAKAGTFLDASTAAALLCAGVGEVVVRRSPRVAVVASGDELIDAETFASFDAQPQDQVPDSNLPMIAGMLRELGVPAVTQRRVSDDPAVFQTSMDELADEHDLIITSGGVSAGAFDVTHQVASEEGVWFGHLDMRPGKPQGLGTWGGTGMICLPGNPVAAWVSFQLFVRPVVLRLLGADVAPQLSQRPTVQARASEDFPASRSGNLVCPVHLSHEDGRLCATPADAHAIPSLVGLGGLVIVDSRQPAPAAGETVAVFPTSGGPRL